MAVGIAEAPYLLAVNGIKIAACCAGIYNKNRLDLALISASPGTRIAAVFTRNAFCAAPVIIARKHLLDNDPLHLLINAGNANAGLGDAGYNDALKTCECLAGITGSLPTQVLPFSTGVIGEPLPVGKICNALPQLLGSQSDDAWDELSRAMMTTDTVPKGMSRVIKIGDKEITITGVAKGSGMIRPDMATMLAFVATDACIEKKLLAGMLQRAVEQSFNRISVDGDTSTNDACVLLATGKAGVPEIDGMDNEVAKKFMVGLVEVCTYLAQAIVRDGEGATKFVTININGGKDSDECLKVATTIAHSPLIKTALFASDPNWGRILAAIGRSGIDNLDINKISISIGDICIVSDGARAPDYTESRGKTVFEQDDIILHVHLNRGAASIQFWTCDLSYDYVRINAEYRT